MATQKELLDEARARGVGEETLADDATKKEIQDVLDSIGPTPEAAAEDAVEGANPDSSEEQFPVSRVISDAESFFGIPGHAMAGALHGYDKDTITLTEAKQAHDAWSKATVLTTLEA